MTIWIRYQALCICRKKSLGTFRKASSNVRASEAPGLNLRQTRFIKHNARERLSQFWAPTGGIAHVEGQKEDSHALLIRGGFIRQTHAGLFQFLPMGFRILEKLERLLDGHMTRLGASKVSLSTFSSKELWRQSGRLLDRDSELFSVTDRKDAEFLLSPTHEEEITSLVKGMVTSHSQLPLSLYQITRKYRDEIRPRQGLLRTREFLMKDLYTFDATKIKALQTYDAVRATYSAFFSDFKLPFLIAEADAGNIGGDVNHEYHYETPKGEDTVITCAACSYTANSEVVKVKADGSCPKCYERALSSRTTSEAGHTFFLGTKYSESLDAKIAVYSGFVDASGQSTSGQPQGPVRDEGEHASQQQAYMQMGCYGIGVSRIIGIIADLLADDRGLNWPRVMAPFETVIVPTTEATYSSATSIWQSISTGTNPTDAIVDDRDKNLGWKLKDADLIGYPVIIILGRAWASERKCEVQCRRLGIKQTVAVDDLHGYVASLLAKL